MSIRPNDTGLSADRLEIWASVATLLERLPVALDAQLQRDSGLTHFEYGVLYALDQAPERSLRMSTLAGYASSTLSRLSRAASRLEAKDWLRRKPDPVDGRFTLAILTSIGHVKVVESTPRHHALITKLVFDPLTATQARQLGTAAQQIAQSVDSTPAWKPPAAE